MTDDTLALTDHPVLQQLVLGHAPMIDRHRQISAMRLTLFPAAAGRHPDAQALLALLAQAWPAEAGRLALNLADEALLRALLQAELPPQLMLEVPAFLATDPALEPALLAQARAGTVLMLGGRPLQPLPPALLGCFTYAVVGLADERRDGLPPPGGQPRQIPHVQSGVETLRELDAAFGRGAVAVLGWPVGDADQPAPEPGRSLKTSVAVVMELMNRVDADEPTERLEAVVKREPTLAYRLLKYINAPIFGLRVEITSFGHAIMMLGHRRMKRWLSLLLVSGNAEPAQRPMAAAAVRRGLLMEELGRASGLDEGQRAELFVCGMFSLLDRLLQQPMATLLESVPTSAVVRQALLDDGGPFAPYLRLVLALEAASLLDIRDGTEQLLMTHGDVNLALLRALVAARQLE